MSVKKNNWLFGLSFLALLGGGFAAMTALGNRSSAPTGEVEQVDRPPEALTPVQGAYAHGGSPNRLGPARSFFKEELANFIVTTDSLRENSEAAAYQEARAKLLASARVAKLPQAVLEKLTSTIDAAIAIKTCPEDEVEDKAKSLMSGTLSLNDSLATANLGFFIDPDMSIRSSGKRSVLLFSFEVERIVLYRSLGHDVRTLRVRRLDALNHTYNLLGFTSPQRRDAIVLDNKVDEHLLRLLPALAKEPLMNPFHLAKKDTYTKWYHPTRKIAMGVIRKELGNAGVDNLEELGELLDRRLQIFEEWNVLLKPYGRQLSPPAPFLSNGNTAGKWKALLPIRG